MEISGAGPAQRALLGVTANTGDLALTPGQRLTALVVETIDARHVALEMAGARLMAETTLPVRVGQRLLLEVVRLAPGIELRALAFAPLSTAEQAAEATLYQARSELPARDLPASVLTSVVSRLGQLAPRDLSGALGKALDVLRPLPSGPTSESSARLAALLQSAGLPFATQLARALGPASAQSAPLPPEVERHRHVLLARARRALDAAPAEEAGTERWVAELMRELDAIARGTQAQEVEQAYRWVKDGVLTLRVPVDVAGGAVWAELRIARDAEAPEAERDERRSFACAFLIELEPLGRIHASLRCGGSLLRADFTVERPEARDWLAAELGSLEAALGGVGFTPALSVAVDPVRLDAEFARRDATSPPAGGALVDVRA